MSVSRMIRYIRETSEVGFAVMLSDPKSTRALFGIRSKVYLLGFAHKQIRAVILKQQLRSCFVGAETESEF